MVLALLCAAWSSLLVVAGALRLRAAPAADPAVRRNLRLQPALGRCPRTEADPSGKGWVYGVARYNGDRIEWFRVFSYAPRPRRVLERARDRGAGAAAPPRARRSWRCSPTRWCSPACTAARALELAMSEDAPHRLPGLAGGRTPRPARQRRLAAYFAGHSFAQPALLLADRK